MVWLPPRGSITRLLHNARRWARRRMSSLPAQYHAISSTPTTMAICRPTESGRLGTFSDEVGDERRRNAAVAQQPIVKRGQVEVRTSFGCSAQRDDAVASQHV